MFPGVLPTAQLGHGTQRREKHKLRPGRPRGWLALQCAGRPLGAGSAQGCLGDPGAPWVEVRCSLGLPGAAREGLAVGTQGLGLSRVLRCVVVTHTRVWMGTSLHPAGHMLLLGEPLPHRSCLCRARSPGAGREVAGAAAVARQPRVVLRQQLASGRHSWRLCLCCESLAPRSRRRLCV